MNNTEVQKALDNMANSINEEELSRVLTSQVNQIVRFSHEFTCSTCDAGPFKNLRGLSVHWRKHMPTEIAR